MNLGTHYGRYLALTRYSDSICHQRDATSSTRCHSRSTGPAPTRAPRSNTDRNTAKFSEMRLTPRPAGLLGHPDDDELVGAVLAVARAAHEVEGEPVAPPRHEGQDGDEPALAVPGPGDDELGVARVAEAAQRHREAPLDVLAAQRLGGGARLLEVGRRQVALAARRRGCSRRAARG